MRKAFAILALAALIASNSFAGTAALTSSSEEGSFKLTVSTSVDSDQIATCVAELKDATTNEIIAAPRFTLKAGGTAEVSSTSERGAFVLKVKTDTEENLAVAEGTFTVDGKTVFAPRISFALR